MGTRALIALAVAAVLAPAAPARAEERWAAPGIDPGQTTCLATSPCSIERALLGASSTTEVVVSEGTYTLTAPLTVTGARIRGEPGGPRPVLEGGTGFSAATLTLQGNAHASHLEVRAAATGQDAAELRSGADADRLVLRSSAGDGAEITADAPGSVVTNTLVVATGGGSTAAGLKLRNKPGGTIDLRNVTVSSSAVQTTGLVCETAGTARSRIVNSIIRGRTQDVLAEVAGAQCSADHSSFRVGNTGVTVTNHSEVDPQLDAEHRPAPGSIPIDGGLDDAANGLRDLVGYDRRQGGRTDIGAYEQGTTFTPEEPDPGTGPGTDQGADPGTDPGTGPDPLSGGGTSGGGSRGGGGGSSPSPAGAAPAPESPPAPAPAPPLPPPPAGPPQLGRSVVVGAGSGRILVRAPGAKRFAPLPQAARLPVGTLVDSRRGEVTLQSALPGERRQSGSFRGGLFTVHQPRAGRGMVDIRLAGGDFSDCRPGRRRARGSAVARAAGHGKAVRRLWSRDKGGRFRTRGRDSVATVRGTRWLTEDRCEGTYTKVLEGAVDVRANAGGVVRRVRAGRSLLVHRMG